MSKYLVICTITKASGNQFFEVEANSEDDAIAKWKNGECEFIEEEVEVTDIVVDSAEKID